MREEADRGHSAIIRISGAPDFHVKLKDISKNGACFIVNSDSSLLNHVKVGDRVDIQLHLTDGANKAAFYKSKILHITEAVGGRFNNHFMVGLGILQRLPLA
jgi:hypothetical protein